MDYQLRDFLEHSSEFMCFICDEDATYVTDSDTHHGGGENGPAFDAPVYVCACEEHKHMGSYMAPIVIPWEYLKGESR